MVPSMKINLPENLNLYCQIYCQVMPPTKINSLKYCVYDSFPSCTIVHLGTVMHLVFIMGSTPYQL